MILRADARAIPLRDGCVQCVVTSPPYWGLRDYGVSGQIGLEATPEAYVATMVEVFREVRRALRADGTVWLNLGDSYAGSANSGGINQNDGGPAARITGLVPKLGGGLKPKDLCGIPWRVAFALQSDGWWLRSDIIWAKPNSMPESVTDRPTRSHEYLFLLTKSERYYYDADAIAEDAIHDGKTVTLGDKSLSKGQANGAGIKASGNGTSQSVIVASRRNKRSVWTINSEPTPEAHFATFPQKLVEPCILAGTSEKGCCAECGAPRMRMTESTRSRNEVSAAGEKAGARANGGGYYRPNSRETGGVAGLVDRTTTGWQPSCAHDAPSVPCLVFDPFIGSGTVGKVAERFGRRWVGCELSADYIAIGRKRTAQMGLQL